MKYIILIISLVSTVSFSQESKEYINNLSFKYSGNWISKSYIDNISATKSPYEAQKLSFQNILIDPTLNQGKFIGISIYAYGNTEASPISYFERINEHEFIYSHSKFENELIGNSCQVNCQS